MKLKLIFGWSGEFDIFLDVFNFVSTSLSFWAVAAFETVLFGVYIAIVAL
jgi:hypothetical protein